MKKERNAVAVITTASYLYRLFYNEETWHGRRVSSCLFDWFRDFFDYQIEQKLPWSVLFEKVSELDTKFALDYALLSDSTLENIFISLARKDLMKSEDLRQGQTSGSASSSPKSGSASPQSATLAPLLNIRSPGSVPSSKGSKSPTTV